MPNDHIDHEIDLMLCEAREECPIPRAHQRLYDAHRLWHQAADQYDDPDGLSQVVRNRGGTKLST